MTQSSQVIPVLARVFFAFLNLTLGFTLLVGLFTSDYHLAHDALLTFVMAGIVAVPLGFWLLLHPRGEA